MELFPDVVEIRSNQNPLGWEFEEEEAANGKKMQKMSEDPIEFCPHCGKKSLKKVPSRSNFILKGGGWFKNTLKPKTETKKDDDV